MERNFQNEILDSLAEGLFTVDKDFKINFFNSAAEKISGYKREDVLGKICKHVFNTNLCESDCPIAKALLNGNNIYDLESKYNCFDLKSFPVKINATVLKNSKNEPVGGVVSFRDITNLIEIDKYLSTKNYHGIVGYSKSMMEIFELIEEISNSNASVLIQGETGTGKELIANAIQETSRRREQKFVKVNCSVLPHNLLASELFGHVKGAFTDAVSDRIGRFELADKGTIFLDEITEMPLNMQAQILRVIQEGAFERVGESVTRKVDVRIIAATNLKIKEALTTGKFREDLFFRLNVIPIEVPPLRNRKDDITFLIKHFIQKFNLIYKKNILDIDVDALDMLMQYDWPGNVREFENAIEYAFVRTKRENSICKCCLPPSIRNSVKIKCKEETVTLGKINSRELFDLLEKNKWNKSAVAKILGVDRTTIWRYLKNADQNKN